MSDDKLGPDEYRNSLKDWFEAMMDGRFGSAQSMMYPDRFLEMIERGSRPTVVPPVYGKLPDDYQSPLHESMKRLSAPGAIILATVEEDIPAGEQCSINPANGMLCRWHPSLEFAHPSGDALNDLKVGQKARWFIRLGYWALHEEQSK